MYHCFSIGVCVNNSSEYSFFGFRNKAQYGEYEIGVNFIIGKVPMGGVINLASNINVHLVGVNSDLSALFEKHRNMEIQ